MRHIAFGCFSLLLAATTVQAAWLEASSDHFVIYGDQSEVAARKFAERLERFHAAMAYVYGKPETKPGPSNRVTVFVVPSTAKVRKVTGARNSYLAGFYLPRAGSSVALVPRLRGGAKDELTGEKVLYHQYAHHFMQATLTTRAYPRWLTEGFAEFFGGVQFKADGTVVLGAPAHHRGAELAYAREVPIRTLLSFDGGASDKKPGYSSFYGQSWVLFHYLQMGGERAGEFAKYRQLLATGHSALAAAESAFGDLDELENDMDAYVKRRKITAFVIPEARLTIGAIALRTLRPGEAAMMPIMMESRVGVSRKEALELVPEARKVAALHPGDPTVLAALAEAEFDAGNDDAAIAAADRAVAIDPQQINAHIQKGYALARKVESGALPVGSWNDVRLQFVKANAVENDHPVPLVQFYLTYMKQGERPTKNAIAGLEWAMQLAPFDGSVRWLVAQQMVADERFADALQTLGPLAYSPHSGEKTDAALRLLKDVEARLQQDKEQSPDSIKVE